MLERERRERLQWPTVRKWKVNVRSYLEIWRPLPATDATQNRGELIVRGEDVEPATSLWKKYGHGISQ